MKVLYFYSDPKCSVTLNAEQNKNGCRGDLRSSLFKFNARAAYARVSEHLKQSA